MELKDQRTLNKRQIEAHEGRFKELSKNMGTPARQNMRVGGNITLAITQGPSSNAKDMESSLAELEQSQVPIGAALKDRAPYHHPLRSGWGTPYYHVDVHIELPW